MRKIFFQIVVFSIFLTFSSSQVLADSAPLLKDGGANPSLVLPGTTVVYSVTYQDADGEIPKFVRVVTSEWTKDMTKVSGEYKNGARYEYRWSPKEGDQGREYHFEASDGVSEIKFPAYGGGTLAPPNVIDNQVIKSRLYLFKKESNQPIANIDLGNDPVVNVAISTDGSYWVAKTASAIYLFSGQNSTPDWKYQCTGGIVSADTTGWAAISSDGNYIAGGCHNGLYFFSKNSNKPLWSYLSNQGYTSVYNVAISAKGDYIALGTTAENNGGLLALFSKDSAQPLWAHRFNPGNVHGLAISADGDYIAAGTHCPDRKTYLFSRQSDQPLVEYVASEGSPVWAAAISADGQSAVYGLDSAGTYDGILLFNPNQKNPVKKWQTEWWVRSLAISANSKYIAVGSGDHKIYLIDKDKDQPVWKFETGDRVGTVGISSNGQYLVGGSKDKKVYLLSKDNNKPLWEFQTDSWVNAVAISANGNYVVAGNGIAHYLAEGQHEIYNNPNKQTAVKQQPSIGPEQTKEGIGLPKYDKRLFKGKMPEMLFGVGFLLSLLALSFYLAILKFPFFKRIKEAGSNLNHARFLSLLHLNTKKIVIILSVTTGIFLILTLASLIFNKPTANQPALNQDGQNLPSDKQGSGVCGNNLCEPISGETKESCPKDCSGGN